MIIGIYGNIAVGKSTVSKYLKEKYHFDYLSLDLLAKEIQQNDQQLIKELQALDSTKVDVLSIDRKQVDLKKMKEAIFYHPKKNKIVSKII
jgi:dephospho-CoA kinase